MSISNKIFSENLVKIRKKKGLSQIDLSDISGISRRMIAHYEKHAANPPFEKIQALADALAISVSELLGLKNEKVGLTDKPFDIRTLKKFRQLITLNKQDRLTIYKMLDILLQKKEYKEKIEIINI